MSLSRKVLVTGADGFIGAVAVAHLRCEGWDVVEAPRGVVGDIGPATRWQSVLNGVTHVLHLAGHVHEPDGAGDTFQRVNVQGSERLAREAASMGVTRFVYVSSVKAHGDVTHGRPLRVDDPLAPTDAYGRSKRDAEIVLHQVSAETGMEIVIVRPPLVCGRGAGGNLKRLMFATERGLPLPFGSVSNRRSMVSVENLAGFLSLCLTHPAAANETFLAADEPSISTPVLLRLLAKGLGVPPRVFPCPPAAIGLAASLIGRQRDADVLLQSLEVDAAKARTLLGWQSSQSLEAAIIDMAREFPGGKA
ncbi:MAG: NAD-dependent epimerase/dehydratase family protein [Parvibaculum sp.]|nr:NAD-dependent epimerase/dehydratase family protein [Parvibaculum sp.]